MLKIRLQRVGRKHEPSFRLVLTNSKNSTKSGKYLEILGNYDSRRAEESNFKADRIKHWMTVGAQVSPTVHNLLISKKIIEGKKINVLPLKKPIIKEEVKTEVKTEVKIEAETFREKTAEEFPKDAIEVKEEALAPEVKVEETKVATQTD